MARTRKQEVNLELWPMLDLQPLLHGGALDAWGVDLDGGIWLAERLGGHGPDDAAGHEYHVVTVREGRKELDVTIGAVPFAIDFIQPLGGTILLARSRQQLRSPAPIPRNGLVYTREGVAVRQFDLGDGIEDVQTRGREIWVGYFDEGVFGGSVGQHGLVCFDHHGLVRYQYQYPPPAGLDGTNDCYALNVASQEDVYLYSYSSFAIAWLSGMPGSGSEGDAHLAAGHWASPIKGSHCLATDGMFALLDGGYNNHDRYALLELGAGHQAALLGEVAPTTRGGRPIQSVRSRGQSIYLNDGKDIYDLHLYAVGGLLTA